MYASFNDLTTKTFDNLMPSENTNQPNFLLEEQFIERRIKQVELHYQNLFNNAHIGLFEIDNRGKYLIINNKFAEIFGYTSASEFIEITGNIHNLNYVDKERYLQLLDLLSIREQISHFETQVYHSQGYKIWVDLNIHTIYNHHGDIIGYEGTVEDVSHRKQSESEMESALQKMQELSELKSQFVSMVSHEFRSGLSIILTSSDLLKIHQDRLDGSQKNKYHTKIYNTVKRLTAMLDDVLQFNKMDVGKLTFQPEYLDLDLLLEEIIQDLANVDHNNHQIILHNDYTQNQVLADEGLLRQILLNLIGNAIKYSPEGSFVEVKVTFTDDKFLFAIKDQGIGIPKGEQESLFKPFYRCKNVQKINGTGLGLAIVKQAVELHGGDIEIQSEVNEGTTFIFTLPVLCNFSDLNDSSI
jgi:PAS domain S-box-containing protein